MPQRKAVSVEYMYREVNVMARGLVMEVNSLPLKLYNLDLILAIDWLGRYKA